MMKITFFDEDDKHDEKMIMMVMDINYSYLYHGNIGLSTANLTIITLMIIALMKMIRITKMQIY